MHTVQNLPPKLRHIYAPRAKSSPKSQARFYPPGKSLPQISGTFMPPGQNLPPNLRQTFAPHA